MDKDKVLIITIYGRADYREDTELLKKDIENSLYKIGVHLGDIEIEETKEI